MEAGPEYFLRELRKVSAALAEPVTVYLFGGGVMALRGFKGQTKDLDIVVRGGKAAHDLIGGFEGAGYYRRRKLTPTYRNLHASAVLDNLSGFRIDLFVDVICRALDYSERMQARATTFDLGPGKMDLRLAALEDVFVLKSVTDRPRDVDDMALIAEQGLDWAAIQREMIAQRRTGNKFFMPIFIQSLEELVERHQVAVPILPKMLEEVEDDLDEIEALNEKAKREHAERAKR